MRQSDAFSTFHPLINFFYFCIMILSVIVWVHPLILTPALICGLIYLFKLGGRGALRTFVLVVPVMLGAALINPMFNHQGVTILGYIGDNPFTLESMYYGVFSGIMLAAVIVWFACYSYVMTSDKFIYLFGRVIPVLSLVFSMVLRFLPRFANQISVVSEAQRGLRPVNARGGGDSEGRTERIQRKPKGAVVNKRTFTGLYRRLRQGVKILSVMVTWALENSVDTADSMRARGYGLQGRTNFTIFRFDSRDRMLLVIMLACLILQAVGVLKGCYFIQFFPSFKFSAPDITGWLLSSGFFIQSITPVLLHIRNEMLWRMPKTLRAHGDI